MKRGARAASPPIKFREHPSTEEVLAIDPKAFWLSYGGGRRDTELTDDGIAVIRIEGPLEHKASWSWDSYEGIVERVREAAEDEDVRAVVFKFDSPGGDVDGLNEAVAELVRIKETSGKPFYGYANELAASAAYALSCACDEIYLPEAAGVGSIGVIAVMCEQTERDKREGIVFEVVASGERKPDGNPHIKISDGARKRMAKRIDTLAGMFFELVAGARGLSAKKVESYEADVFFGADAVEKKLADGVSSWPDFIALVSGGVNGLDNVVAPQSRSTKKPTNQSDDSVGAKDNTMGLLALRKKKTEASSALKSAKTEAAKKKAGKEFSAAVVALAKAEAVAEAKKMKKTKYVEETEETDDEEDEEDESTDEEDEADDSDDEDDDDSDDEDEDAEDESDDGDAEDESEDAEDEDAKKSKKAKKAAAARKAIAALSSGKLSGKALLRQLAGITGKSTAAGIVGTVRAALEGAGRVSKVEGELRAMKVDALITAGRKAGKIEKSLVAFCRKMGNRSPQELKAYLDAKTPNVRTEDDAPILPREFATLAGGVLTAEQAEIARRMGMTPEQAASAAKISATKVNGAAPRH